MSINQILDKIKPFYTLILLLAIASIFFALGRLYGISSAKEPLKIEYSGVGDSGLVIGSTMSSSSEPTLDPAKNLSGAVIGSKTGKKYYFPWCGTAKRIKPENQVHFGSIQEARNAGYLPGGNCKGLK